MTLIRWKPTRDLTRWSPFADLDNDLVSMQNEINRTFDRFFGQNKTEEGEVEIQSWMPTVDIIEKEDRYHLKIDLPGVSRDDVKITLKENVLTISGEKKNDRVEKNSNYYRSERAYGRFERSFTLPSSVQGDKIEASYKDGVLAVDIPKAEEAKVKEIQVKVS